MTCRHAKGDPNCSSTVGGPAWQEMQDAYTRTADEQRRAVEKERDKAQAEVVRLTTALQKYQRATNSEAPTPDASNYEVLDHKQVGTALVLKVQYPNCSKCSYEGVKVLVYEACTVDDALRWRVIDPHFVDPSTQRPRREAPGPSARFPGSELGWADAIAYATDVLGHRIVDRSSPMQQGSRCYNRRHILGDPPEGLRCVGDAGHVGPHAYNRDVP